MVAADRHMAHICRGPEGPFPPAGHPRSSLDSLYRWRSRDVQTCHIFLLDIADLADTQGIGPTCWVHGQNMLHAAASTHAMTAATSAVAAAVDRAPGQSPGIRRSMPVSHETRGLELGVLEVSGDTILRADRGGMKVHWIYRGQGEVFLPPGYRTQEGGGDPLPAEYSPDPIDAALGRHLAAPAKRPVRHFARRRRPRASRSCGDWHGRQCSWAISRVELWELEHVARPWAATTGRGSGRGVPVSVCTARRVLPRSRSGPSKPCWPVTS